ncbi:MAG: LemA family protein [Flavobacteriaceae bacterium]|jgi:LemA family protein|nr:LemA family protein [Flavobacteriaceae bacterium]
MNNKGCFGIGTIGLVIIGLVLAIGFWGVRSYNSLVKENNNVLNKWSNVETIYQKRANLIPNLQNTVKSYAKFEQETLTKVVEARSKATQVTVDPTNMTEEDMAKFQKAQGELSSSLGRLMMVVEQYPELKADQQYINFQREYIAIENSIRTEIVYYNEAVTTFNNEVESFPANLFVAFFSKFKAKPYFKADEGASKAPEVFKD